MKSPSMPRTPWNYEEAFARNTGLITPDEQQRLRRSRIAIVGMGGVGGVHAVTLARLGVGGFTIADPDVFEVANTNRQYGARQSTVGHPKAQVMAEVLRDINPEADVRVFSDPISTENAEEFLKDADLFVDGIDFFEIDVRRLLFRLAAQHGRYAITAAPMGFSTAWLVFAPGGMSFDRYFDFSDRMQQEDKLAAFAVGLSPKALQREYMSMKFVNLVKRTAPSSSLACQLASGVLAAEAVRLLLGRGSIRAAPYYQQFDAYLGRFVQGRLWLGNRNPLQRLKRWYVKKHWGHRFKETAQPVVLKDTSIHSLQDRLLSAAIRAPSGDNTQPWRFVLHRDRITVFVDEARDSSPMNAGQRMSRIACGAAVENMLRVAQAEGWQAEVEPGSDACLAVISWRPAPEATLATGRVEDTIKSRVTNRRMYDRRPVPDKVLGALKSATPVLDNVTTHWIVDRVRISRLAAVISQADAIMFGQKAMRWAFLSNVRFDAAYNSEVEEGLSLACLEASAPERLGMRTMFRGPNWLFKLSGTQYVLGSRARKLVKSASGLCVVVAPEDPRTSYMDLLVGRAMQRAWLALHEEGLAVQPMMSLLVLDNLLDHGSPELIASLGRKRLLALRDGFRALVPEVGSGRPAFLMRFGFAPPPSGRTGRRPLSAVTTLESS
jgi:sulfur-carrier protein adenylyltransferase/sulfurtransferase